VDVTLRRGDRIDGDPGTAVAFTDSSLDVGDRAADDVRRAALDAVSAATGARPLLMRQVHGSAVAVVDDTTDTPPTCDALVTTTPGVVLLARAADCVPVLLADPVAGVVAAAHSGRQGLAGGVVPAAVERMRALGAGRLTAWVGPHVCGACYEVPEEMREQVATMVPQARATTSWGTPSLDLGAGVRAQLAATGVDEVREVGVCTREDLGWPSHRRDGEASTRFAGLVWITA
jgi:YfiH family protein